MTMQDTLKSFGAAQWGGGAPSVQILEHDQRYIYSYAKSHTHTHTLTHQLMWRVSRRGLHRRQKSIGRWRQPLCPIPVSLGRDNADIPMRLKGVQRHRQIIDRTPRGHQSQNGLWRHHLPPPRGLQWPERNVRILNLEGLQCQSKGQIRPHSLDGRSRDRQH